MADKPSTALELVKNNNYQQHILAILPDFAKKNHDRFMQFAIEATKSLQKSKKPVEGNSIALAIYQAAKLGLSPDPVLGHAHIIPFGGVAVFIPGYKGYIHLALRSGKIKDIQAYIVYENEKFAHYNDETGVHLTHSPSWKSEKDRGKPILGYSLVHWNDGSKPRITVMPYHEIDAIAKTAIAKARGRETPWKTHRPRMDLKTVIIRTCKTLDLTPEVGEAIYRSELHDQGKVDTVVPADVSEIIDEKAIAQAEEAGKSSKPTVSNPVETPAKTTATPQGSQNTGKDEQAPPAITPEEAQRRKSAQDEQIPPPDDSDAPKGSQGKAPTKEPKVDRSVKFSNREEFKRTMYGSCKTMGLSEDEMYAILKEKSIAGNLGIIHPDFWDKSYDYLMGAGSVRQSA